MSLPARIWTNTSQWADVRVNRGSTWISVAPLSLAFIGQRKATGCASAVFVPMNRMQVLLIRRRRPPPERGAQTGHRGGVSDACLVFDGDDPQPSAEEFLDQVVLL